MPLYYTQAATSLQKVASDGTISTLTLPANVTLAAERPRFAILGRFVVMVNSPTVNLVIDPVDDAVYPMSLRPPPSSCAVAAGSSTGLTGVYRARYSFLIKDSTGRVISESPLSQESAATASLSNQDISVTGILTSDQTSVNARRIYRTLAGGRAYFHEVDLDGNTETTSLLSLSDENISQVPVPLNLGNPPGSAAGQTMELIVHWKGRLWGRVGGYKADKDTLWWSELRRFYAWAPINTLPIPPVGVDEAGITAFIPRRDYLGIAKRDSISVITSVDPLAGQRRTLVEGVGVIAPESVVVFDDIAWFLGEGGVYQWDNSGIRSISEKQVHTWFTTSGTFQQASFDLTVGWYNPVRDSVNFLLPATGQATLNRWIEYYPKRGIWLGPHLTSAFTPTYASLLEDTNDLAMPTLASSDGFLWKEQSTRTDDTATAIDFDVTEQFHSANTPDIIKLWLQPSMITKIEASGTLTVTPTVGNLGASAGSGISHDLTLGRERLARLGTGQFMKLRFRQNTAAIDTTLYGVEVPVHELGRR